jgi:N-acetylglucosamine-6-phosphate deacetylase
MRYFDLQVNGYAGVDFNREEWTVAELERACERLRAEGVEAILATVITAPLERMAARLRRLVAGREASSVIRAMIAGFHIEGPFLNAAPGYIGAHPPTAARPADLDSMQRLLDAAAGLARIVTLAPESDADLRVTRYLAARSVVVSGGHCDPSTRRGFDHVHPPRQRLPPAAPSPRQHHPARPRTVGTPGDWLHRRRRACAV